MMKNTFLNKVLLQQASAIKALVLFSIWFIMGTSTTFAQNCGFVTGEGCPNTDYANYGFYSNNNAATIEYDNFVSGFHTTMVRQSSGDIYVWGENAANNGTGDVLTPSQINSTNYPALGSAKPLKFSIGSNTQNDIQAVILASDGLYVWGNAGEVVNSSLTTNSVFQKITVGGNAMGLPAGVNPADVKMMQASNSILSIVTCSGAAYVLRVLTTYHDFGDTSTTTWVRVQTAPGVPLTGVVAMRVTNLSAIALKSDGTIWTWGLSYLGNGTAPLQRNFATQMVTPSTSIKMVGCSSVGISGTAYYVLATDGNLYSLGQNLSGQLGDFTTVARTSWIQPMYTSTGPVMNNIKWFSAQEHDYSYGSMNVINANKDLYVFGNNNASMLGGTGNSIQHPYHPPSSLGSTIAVETGGHTSMIINECNPNFGYVGHRIKGSMGNGSNLSVTETTYTFATAPVDICGAAVVSFTASPASGYTTASVVTLTGNPVGGTFSIVSGPGVISGGNILSFTGAGTVIVRYDVTTVCGTTVFIDKTFNIVAAPCASPPTVALSATTGSTCGTTPVTVSGNTFGGSATAVTVTENGAGTITAGSSSSSSPFSFTYTPAAADAGTTVTITVTTNNPDPACTAATATYTLTVNATPATPTVTVTPPTCTVATGTITVNTPTGATIQYRIDGGAWQSSATFSGVASGNHTIEAQDTATGCISDAFTANVPAQPATPATPVVSYTCTAGVGTITVTSPTGAGLEYSNNGGAWQTSTTFAGLTDGSSNTITVRNASGCTATGSATVINCGCVNQPTLALSAITGSTCVNAPITVSGNTFGGSATAVTVTENGVGSITAGASSSSSPFNFTYTPAAADAGTTVTITVTTNNPNGAPCTAATATYTLTVATAANAGVISGTQNICVGSTSQLSTTGTGGTWSITPTSVATISASGLVTGLAAGTATVSYTVVGTGGCPDAVATYTINVTAAPNAGTLSGTQNICVGQSTTFTSNGTSGGTWSTSNGSIASVDSVTGVVNGVSAGTATITYTVVGTGGCPNATATRTVTVTTAPVAGTISGTQNICVGFNSQLSTTGTGGTWFISPTSVATISASGLVTGLAAGTATVSYTVVGTGGCPNAVATYTINVTAPVSAGTLSGTQNICVGQTTTFTSNGTSGGTWSTSNGSIASVDSVTGVVNGVSAGTATITYTVVGTGGCPNSSATRTVTVTTAPVAGTISGTQNICSTGTTQLTTTGTGGTWSITPTSVATISTSGLVTGVSAGTATVSYTVVGTGGCPDAVATYTINVTAPVSAGTLSGTQNICVGQTTAFASSGTTGGTWSSSNPSIASVDSSTGVVNGVTAGTATITYTVVGTGGCPNASATRTVTVTVAPDAGVLSGNQAICEGDTSQFTTTGMTGGAWSSSDTSIATVSTTGLVTGVSEGTATITFTVTGTGGCPNSSATRTITVTAPPYAGVIAPLSVTICMGTDIKPEPVGADPGGTWTSSNPAIATVDAVTGNVIGLSPGTVTITYTVTGTGGCADVNSTASITVTFQAAPNAGNLTGNQQICVGQTTDFNTDGDLTGTWSSSNTAVATVNSVTGLVTSIAAGTATISYTVVGTNGCIDDISTLDVTVTAPANAGVLSGTQTVCVGGTTTFSTNGNTGGTWTSSNTGVAIVDSLNGTILGIAAGTATISYTVIGTGGCPNATATRTVTVTAPPAQPITMVTQPTCTVATGTVTTILPIPSAGLTYTLTGSVPVVAAVTNTTGVFSNVAPGIYTIYASIGGCNSTAAVVTVNPQPATPAAPTVSTTAPTCSAAGTATITNFVPTNSYTFTPAGPSVAGGAINGMVPGTSYTVTTTANGCTSVPSASFSIQPMLVTPAVPTVSTTPATCAANGTATITNYSATNTYTFSPSGPTVGALGVISGLTAGTSYTVTATANGCTSAPSASFSVQPMLMTPAVPTVATTAATCSAAGTATISNFVPTNSYTFTPAGPTVSGGAISGMVPGTSYTVTATANGCTSVPSASFSIQPMLVTPAVPIVSTTPATCSANGTATITNYSATNTYTFSPTGPTVGALGVISGLTAGTSYTVTATANGCTSAPSASFSVQPMLMTPAVPVIANVVQPTCTNANGSFTISNYSSSNSYTISSVSGSVLSGPSATGLVVATAGTYTVTATATVNGCSSTPSSSVTINPQNCADIVTVKTDGQTMYVAGQPVTYTITVTNNGPTAATNVNVVDTAPAGTTITSWSSTAPSSGSGNINDTIATLANGSTVTYTVVVNVPVDFTGNLVNTVTVTSSTPDPTPGCTTCTDTDTPNTTVAANDINNTFINTPVSGNVLTNDSDPQGHTQTVTPAVLTNAGEGTVTINADGTYTFTPVTGWTGTAVFTYTVCDNGMPQACDTATLTIEVIGTPNDPATPNDVVANDDTAATEGATPVVINVIANDFDPNGDTFTVTTNTLPSNGTVVYNNDGTFTYTPNAGFEGTDTFTYTICDNGTPQACDTATVTVTVEPTNTTNDTNANDDAYNGDQYEPITGDITDNDTDPEGNTQTVTTYTQPTNGTVVVNPDGTFTYTPTGEYTGPDSFTYTVCDNGMPQACDTATVYLTVNPNNTTVAENDINNTFINTPVSGNVLTNDSDPQGHTQTVTPAVLTNAGEGTVTINADGTYTFTPVTGWTGTAVFTYTVCDNGMPQACDTATLSIEVMPNPTDPTSPNDVVANNDTATTEGTTPVVINVTANDFDPNGDAFTITPGSITDPANGSVTIDSNGNIVYTPDAGFSGTDTFTYEICDNGTPQACDTATVTVTVEPANTTNDTYANDDAYNGNQYEPISGDLTDNDTDPEGNTQTVTTYTQPTNGTVVVNPDGTFTYTPTGEYTGPDSFTYTVCDNGTPQACDTATVYLTVNPNNTTVAANDINNTFINTPVSGNVLTNDSDPQGHTQTVTPAVLTNAGEGTVTINADGTYTFTPVTGWTGTAVFTYTVCDNGMPQACDTATLSIEVMPNPTDPTSPNDVVANNDTATTEGTTPVVINVTANDFDPNGDAFTITPGSITDPANGSVTIDSNGNIVYTPDAGFSGTDTFTYEICDNGTPQACDTATVTVTVEPANTTNDTYANDDAYNGNQYEPISGDLTDNDTDPEGNTQTVTTYTQPTNGTVVVNPDGTFTYTPTGEYTGPDSFTYTVCDNGTPQACDTATVYLTVNPNNTTVAANDINNTFINTPVSGNVLTNDSDPQGHTQTVTPAVLTNAGEGTVTINADGTYTFTPVTGWTGTAVFTYTVCDNGMPQACDTATLSIEVMPNPTDPTSPNDVVANNDTATTEGTTPVVIDVTANDFDPNGDTLGTPTIVTQPMYGTVVIDPVTGNITYTPTSESPTGTDTFTYEICDNGTPQACDTATVTVTVEPANTTNDTNANDDAYNGNQYEPISGDLTDNDTDPEGNTQTVTTYTQPTNGTVVVNPDGTFTYTPTGEYTGPDSFTYTVCDNGTPQACDTATVYLTVNPNNTTVAANDINNTFINTPVSGNVLTNDSDPQGHTQTVTPAVLTNAGEGTVTINADGTYTFTPVTGWTGTAVFTYTVCDNGMPQACDTATLSIEVMPNPTDPTSPNDVVANNDTATTEGTTPVVIDVTANDFDPNGDTLGTPTIVTQPMYGTVVIDPVTGNITYTPTSESPTGTDTFTYEICDNGTPQACDTATVTVTVEPANTTNDTNANDDAYNGNQYEPISGDLTDNDTDPEGNTQTVTTYTQPTNGTVVVNPDGTFTYTPTGEYTGPDSFTYTVCDNGTPQACDTATVYLTVNPNNTTVAANDINNTFINTPVSGNVLTNDSDPQGHTQTVTPAVLTNAGEGTVTINADGTYTFTPVTGWTGTAVFTYTVCDNGMPQACDTATLSIEVMPNPTDPTSPNDVVANNDTATTEGTTPVVIDVTANDFDPNGDTLGTPTIVTQPMYGTVVIDPVTGNITYTPTSESPTGTDTFTYEICDNGTPQACDTATVTVTVEPANTTNDTNANDDAYNGNQYEPISGDLTDNDTDPEGNTQTVTTYTQPTNGTVVVNPDGTFTYTPTGEYTGPDSFTYTVCDNGTPQACDTATVYLTVNPNNTTVAANDINNTFINTPVSGNVLTNDSDPQGHTQTVTPAVLTNAGEGTVTINADGTYTFTPVTGWTGTAVFTYTVCDNGMPQACDTATLSIEVMPNPTDPTSPNDVVANNDTATTEGTTPVVIDVTANDFDPNGDTLGTPTIVTQPMYGTVVIDPVTGNITYTPTSESPTGTDTFTYEICDNGTPQACDTATVTVTVEPANTTNDTYANDDAYNGNQYEPISGDLTDNDTDPEGNTQTVTTYTQPTNGTVVVNPDGTFTYTPDAGYTGPDSFTYTVCDNGTPQACDTATVYLTVNPAPSIEIVKTSSYNAATNTITYTFVVNNTGNVALTDVVVNDTLFTPAQIAGPLSLAVGGTHTFTATYTPTQAQIDAGQADNQATATGTDPYGTDVTDLSDDSNNPTNSDPNGDGNPDDVTVTSIPHTPSIQFEKEGTLVDNDGNGADEGDTINYTFTVENTGNVTLTSVTIDDATLNLTNLAVTPGTLAPGAIGTATATYTLTQADIDAGQFENYAFAEGTPPATPSNPTPTPVTDESSDPTPCTTCTIDPMHPEQTIVPLPATPSLVITKDSTPNFGADGIPQPGETITYNFVATNNGNVTLTNVTVTDQMAVVPQVQMVTPSTLAPGQSGIATAIYTLTQADITAGQVNNVATATGTTPSGTTIPPVVSTDPTPGCAGCLPVPSCATCTSNSLPHAPAITVIKDGVLNTGSDNVASVNDVITYTFTVTNTGNVPLTTVTVSDPLLGTTPIVVTPSILAPGQVGTATATYTLTQANIEAGQVNNIATASGTSPATPTNPNGVVVTDTSSDPTPGCLGCTMPTPDHTVVAVPQSPELTITKDSMLNTNVVAPLGTANVGDTITYMFAVTNTGNVTVIGVSITDTNLGATPIVVTPSTLAPGQTGTATATYLLTQPDITAGVVYNIATANGTGPKGQPVSDTSVDPTNPVTPSDTNYNPSCPDCTVTPLTYDPSIAVVKVADFTGNIDNAQVGDIIDYTFTVTNTGNVPLSNVNVVDTLITNGSMTYVSGDANNNQLLDLTETWIFTATYVLTQQDIVRGSVTNQATANGTGPATPTNPNGLVVSDLSDDAIGSLVDNDPTVTTFNGCQIIVYNAITPNGDMNNDYLRIDGISCYPKNKVEIYNRWGVLVYEDEGYDNATNVFTGYSNGRVTIKQGEGLPTGTYYYVLEYTDANGTTNSKAGYLYLTRD